MKIGSPAVGERTMEAPSFSSGEPSRQNGPIRFAVVSSPPKPLFCRQTSDDAPSEPEMRTTSLCDSVLSCPSVAMIRAMCWNSASVRLVSRTKAFTGARVRGALDGHAGEPRGVGGGDGSDPVSKCQRSGHEFGHRQSSLLLGYAVVRYLSRTAGRSIRQR